MHHLRFQPQTEPEHEVRHVLLILCAVRPYASRGGDWARQATELSRNETKLDLWLATDAT